MSLKDLAVTGRDLIEAGMEPGKEIGVCLNELLQAVIEEPEMNVKEKLLAIAKPSGVSLPGQGCAPGTKK